MDRYVPLPPLPPRIGRLNELAYDLWWSWTPRGREVFRDLDYPLWRFTDHNPVLLLHLIEPERLEHAASDAEFLRLYDEAIAALDVVRAGAGTWWSRRLTGAAQQPVAWVAPEFALHQSLPIDASAVGVLSGDFCKEASDLGVPLVGVGLMYPRGYAHQRLSAEGWQQERYEYIDWSDAPIGPALCPDGSRCTFSINLDGEAVQVGVWQVRAGRVSLFLLDTDLQENTAWNRELSSRNPGADAEARLRQAVLLGAGAARTLSLLGVTPSSWHVADAPATPLVLERIHDALAGGETFDAALARVQESTMFSTRDAAPAARDSVPFASMDRHIAATWPALQPHRGRVHRLGEHESDRTASFNLSVLGARTSAVFNTPDTAAKTGAAQVWTRVRGTVSPSSVRSVPDGIHLSTWISADLARLFDDAVGADWRERQDADAVWSGIGEIPDDALWGVRQRLRGYLVEFMRERARRRWAREQASGSRLVALGTLLDASTLTIGFARRFTDAARPGLIFHDVERLARIVTDARRPVQIVFAGKAHPDDERGKHHLQRVFRQALDPSFGGRVAFLEDYDLHVARLLVQGCDVWLSTPERGTPPSIGALKASINGAPHVGTPDAWWAHGCTGDNGWLLDGGHGRDPAAQDATDARVLYGILEEQVIPAFYDRDRGGIPPAWVALMKRVLETTVPRFCARRAMKTLALATTDSRG